MAHSNVTPREAVRPGGDDSEDCTIPDPNRSPSVMAIKKKKKKYYTQNRKTSVTVLFGAVDDASTLTSEFFLFLERRGFELVASNRTVKFFFMTTRD